MMKSTCELPELDGLSCRLEFSYAAMRQLPAEADDLQHNQAQRSPVTIWPPGFASVTAPATTRTGLCMSRPRAGMPEAPCRFEATAGHRQLQDYLPMQNEPKMAPSRSSL